MNNRYFSTEAIVLKRFNYGEADRILTLFTRDFGKMRVIAKGVRKPSSRKRGHVELFNHFKAQVVNGRGMGILTEAESVIGNQASPSLAKRGNEGEFNPENNLARLSHAYQFAELIDRLLPEHEPNSEVFELLSNTLQSLGGSSRPGLAEISVQGQALQNLDRYFKHRLIRILGFWPHEHTSPPDIDEYLDSILERPLNSRMLDKYV